MSKTFYRGIDLNNTAIELVVENDIITAVRPIAAESSLPWLLPSLVDLQHNGALAIAYNNLAEDAPAQLRQVAEHLIRNGIGRCLATFTTCPYERLNTAARAFDQALCADKMLEALFPGIFHEGVFISPKVGWRGGHDPAYILPPDWEKFSRLQKLSGGRIRLVNIAPEEPGALDFIRKAHAAGIKVALGHCCPDTATIAAAVEAGAEMVTHFGNGASPEIHRFHNPFWGFLDQAGLALGLIATASTAPNWYGRHSLQRNRNCFMVSDPILFRSPGTYHASALIAHREKWLHHGRRRKSCRRLVSK